MSLDDLEKTLRKANIVISEGPTHWDGEGDERPRQDEHEYLDQGAKTIRDLYVEGVIGEERHEQSRATVAAAQLVLGAADYRHKGTQGVIAAQYPDDVLERMLTFDKFRQYDVYEAEEKELQQRIASKDTQLYELVQDEIAPQLSALNDALTGTHSKLDSYEMAGLKELYSDRLEKLHEAVAIYIRKHGIPNVAEEWEEAIQETADAATTRADIVTAVEESLDGLEASIQQGLRDERRQLETELHRAGFEGGTIDDDRLAEVLDRIDNLLDKQSRQQSQLEEYLDTLQSGADTLDGKIANLESRLSSMDLEDRVEALVNDELEKLRAERDRIQHELDQLSAEREELEAARESLGTDRERMSAPETDDFGESDRILAGEARIAEYDYTSRFETSVHDHGRVWLPGDEVFEADSAYWSNHHSRSDDRYRMRQLLAEHDDEDRDLDKLLEQYPLNRRSRFVVSETSRFGLREEERLVLDLRVYAHLEMYAKHDADNRPATREDLLSVVNEAVREAESADTPHLVTVASPTGWTDSIEQTVSNGNGIGASFSRLLGIVLVDLSERQFIYDDSDSLVTENLQLFTFETPSESVAECEQEIRERYVEPERTSYVTVKTVAQETRFERSTIVRAFKNLEQKGVGTRQQTKYGLCLYFGDGT
jgi:hypothetical protein